MRDENVLGMYLNEINKIPLLSYEEECELARKAQAGDKAARDRLVNSNLRFVVNVAKKYQNHGLDLTDLISEGNIGLLSAIEKYDVSKGYHFISYAVWWIRQSILKAICEKSRAIRLPMNRANELVQIEHARKEIKGMMSETEEIQEIGLMLDMDAAHVREMLNIARDMVSLDAPVAGAGGKEGSQMGDFIEDNLYKDPETLAEEQNMREDVHAVVDSLKPNEAQVIRMRYGLTGMKPMSLKEVGEECNLTKERIRQIEKTAIGRMQHSTRIRRLEDYMVA
ncbi:MAG: RNA polymerase sigma factor RpoD/SigA [Treponema sp.]|nr:RNA polymerase sigma factor RpoD/SigA [Treponema sp.]